MLHLDRNRELIREPEVGLLYEPILILCQSCNGHNKLWFRVVDLCGGDQERYWFGIVLFCCRSGVWNEGFTFFDLLVWFRNLTVFGLFVCFFVSFGFIYYARTFISWQNCPSVNIL